MATKEQYEAIERRLRKLEKAQRKENAAARPPRKKSAYQVFMGRRLSELKTEEPDMPQKNRMAKVASEWKAQKAQSKNEESK